MGHNPGNEPLNLMRCYSCGLPHLFEALGWNSCLWPNLQLCFFFTVAHFMAYDADPTERDELMCNK